MRHSSFERLSETHRPREHSPAADRGTAPFAADAFCCCPELENEPTTMIPHRRHSSCCLRCNTANYDRLRTKCAAESICFRADRQHDLAPDFRAAPCGCSQ